MQPSNRGIHPWLIEAYIEISKSELEEISKRKLLNKILTFGYGLPKVDGASYFLNHDDYFLIANSYELSLKKLN